MKKERWRIPEETKQAAIAEAEALGLPLTWAQYKEIGKKHGVSHASVWNWIKAKHGREKAVKAAESDLRDKIKEVNETPKPVYPLIKVKEAIHRVMAMYQETIDSAQYKIKILESVLKDLAA